MATRYGRAFGETFYYLEEYIDEPSQLNSLMKQENKVSVIIDCVDNNKTRFIIKESIRQYHEDTDYNGDDTIYISSGNEEHAGQVVFSYKIGAGYREYEENYDLKIDSPDLIDIFPNMDIGLLPDEESCAERAVSAPQNIATNMTAADIIFGYVNKLLNNLPVDTMAFFFDSQTMLRKAYSGRVTHIKELLKMVEGNEKLLDFTNDKWSDDTELVKAPSYEEVITSSTEVDTILENAKVLEEADFYTLKFRPEDVGEHLIQEYVADNQEVYRNIFFDKQLIIQDLKGHFEITKNTLTNNIEISTKENAKEKLTELGLSLLLEDITEEEIQEPQSVVNHFNKDFPFFQSVLNIEQLETVEVDTQIINDLDYSSLLINSELYIDNVQSELDYVIDESNNQVFVATTRSVRGSLTDLGQDTLISNNFIDEPSDDQLSLDIEDTERTEEEVNVLDRRVMLEELSLVNVLSDLTKVDEYYEHIEQQGLAGNNISVGFIVYTSEQFVENVKELSARVLTAVSRTSDNKFYFDPEEDNTYLGEELVYSTDIRLVLDILNSVDYPEEELEERAEQVDMPF